MKKERICPLCKGEGYYTPDVFKQRYSMREFRITQAKKLRSMGLSIREIMDVMAYRSPKSVQDLLNK